MEIGEFAKTVCKSNSIWEKFKFFNLGQLRVSKITFDFSKQIEKLPT